MEANGPVENLPHILFFTYQAMFAALTPALISGAYAERIRFSAMLLFSLFWLLCIYAPLAHWVWGGGWLARLDALDFAGGAVVHMSSGAAALAAAHVLGRRKALDKGQVTPHNLPFTLLGAGILWFGWFGFNAGSALASNGTAVLAFFTTQVATGTAALSWVLTEKLVRGKPTTLGAASGAVAGLVAITPGAGFGGSTAAILIGLAAGAICYLAIFLKEKLGYDDALDVVAVHGVGGLWGALATGLFASAGATGLFFGNPRQLWVQLVAALSAMAYSALATSAILLALKHTVGLRVTEEEELQGLDLSLHDETGYSIN